MQEFKIEMRFGVRLSEMGAIIIYDVSGDQEPFYLSKLESELLRGWLEEAEDVLSKK